MEKHRRYTFTPWHKSKSQAACKRCAETGDGTAESAWEDQGGDGGEDAKAQCQAWSPRRRRAEATSLVWSTWKLRHK